MSFPGQKLGKNSDNNNSSQHFSHMNPSLCFWPQAFSSKTCCQPQNIYRLVQASRPIKHFEHVPTLVSTRKHTWTHSNGFGNSSAGLRHYNIYCFGHPGQGWNAAAGCGWLTDLCYLFRELNNGGSEKVKESNCRESISRSLFSKRFLFAGLYLHTETIFLYNIGESE